MHISQTSFDQDVSNMIFVFSTMQSGQFRGRSLMAMPHSLTIVETSKSFEKLVSHIILQVVVTLTNK